jgi:hypothetical protein
MYLLFSLMYSCVHTTRYIHMYLLSSIVYDILHGMSLLWSTIYKLCTYVYKVYTCSRVDYAFYVHGYNNVCTFLLVAQFCSVQKKYTVVILEQAGVGPL